MVPLQQPLDPPIRTADGKLWRDDFSLLGKDLHTSHRQWLPSLYWLDEQDGGHRHLGLGWRVASGAAAVTYPVIGAHYDGQTD
jgi:hypothetical protein